jgi:hypothetical protein
MQVQTARSNSTNNREGLNKIEWMESIGLLIMQPFFCKFESEMSIVL